MARDPQQRAVYDAEFRFRRWLEQGTVKIFGSTWTPEPEIVFGNVESIQNYVDIVLDHLGKPQVVRVRSRRGAAKAHYEPWTATIAIPPESVGGKWALRETVVLHELAHHLTRYEEAHGPSFARAFVDLHHEAGYNMRARLLEIALLEAGAALGK